MIAFNNKKFFDYFKEIYPSQLTVEKAIKSDHPADYLDPTFIIHSGGKLSTGLYDKCDDLDFYIVNLTSHMWILKNSTGLLSSLDQLDVCTAKSVQIFDFSTLYNSIPHDLLKSRISNLVHNAVRKKNGSVRYTHIKVTRRKGYFTHEINGSGDSLYTADNICKIIEFLIENIFVQFGGCLFHQIIRI